MKFTIDALAVSLIATMLVGCGGEGTTSAPPIITVPGVTPVAPPTPPVVKTRFDKVVSASVLSGGNETSSPNLKLYYEGIAVEDVNGDGHKDLIITNLGDPGKAVTDRDPPISIFLNDGKNKLIVADTTRLAPAGWVNDYVFLDSNKNGVKEIIAIDHGRELAGPPFPGTQLRAYEWDGTKFAELTSKTSGNTPAYNHSSSNSGDLNDDGLLDFTVATISSSSKLYYGDPTTIFKLGAEYSFSDFGSTGTTAILPKERIAVFLPYDTWDKANTDFNNAEFVKNGVISRQDARTGVLPSNYGYSLINVADINGDGLTDFVALGENPNTGGDGKRVFVTFMQNVSGKFDIFNSFPSEPQITDSKQSVGWLGRIWSEHKFSLFDIDGDKKLDLFWGAVIDSKPSDLKYNVFYGDSSGRFARNENKSSELFKDVSWEGTARTHMADFNGDGLGDLLVLQQNNGLITPIIFINAGI